MSYTLVVNASFFFITTTANQITWEITVRLEATEGNFQVMMTWKIQLPFDFIIFFISLSFWDCFGDNWMPSSPIWLYYV